MNVNKRGSGISWDGLMIFTLLALYPDRDDRRCYITLFSVRHLE